MAYEQRDNEGSLFPNDRKSMDRQPDMRGNIRVDGKDYWLSAWNKANGRISLSIQRKDTITQKPSQSLPEAAPVLPSKPLKPADDNDIPF